MMNLEEMSVEELTNLKVNIDMEIGRRKRLEYDKAVKKFYDAFYELYSNYPNEDCFTDGNGTWETWEELYENYDWNF